MISRIKDPIHDEWFFQVSEKIQLLEIATANNRWSIKALCILIVSTTIVWTVGFLYLVWR